MVPIDNNFLEELGLGSVPQEEKDKMVAHIQLTLQDRIGAVMETKLNESQLDEFDNILSSGDIEATKAWLGTNLSDYDQIVQEEIRKIKEEIKPQVASIVQNPANSAPPTSL
jgi:hypothetical protein